MQPSTSTSPSPSSSPSSRSNAAPSHTNIKRSKPLKYAYEKEIVLYAHHKNLDYFSTECIYSPEAFRGSARALIKNLERVRPSAILDVVRSGEDMARLVPGWEDGCGRGGCGTGEEEEVGGCGSDNARMPGVEAMMEKGEDEQGGKGLEVEITSEQFRQRRKKNGSGEAVVPLKSKPKKNKGEGGPPAKKAPPKQVMGSCKRCGYLSSQEVCKACVLLEGLNKSRPKNGIEVGYEEVVNGVKTMGVQAD